MKELKDHVIIAGGWEGRATRVLWLDTEGWRGSLGTAHRGPRHYCRWGTRGGPGACALLNCREVVASARRLEYLYHEPLYHCHSLAPGNGRVGQIIAQLLSEQLIPIAALDVTAHVWRWSRRRTCPCTLETQVGWLGWWGWWRGVQPRAWGGLHAWDVGRRTEEWEARVFGGWGEAALPVVLLPAGTPYPAVQHVVLVLPRRGPAP